MAPRILVVGLTARGQRVDQTTRYVILTLQFLNTITCWEWQKLYEIPESSINSAFVITVQLHGALGLIAASHPRLQTAGLKMGELPIYLECQQKPFHFTSQILHFHHITDGNGTKKSFVGTICPDFESPDVEVDWTGCGIDKR